MVRSSFLCLKMHIIPITVTTEQLMYAYSTVHKQQGNLTRRFVESFYIIPGHTGQVISVTDKPLYHDEPPKEVGDQGYQANLWGFARVN